MSVCGPCQEGNKNKHAVKLCTDCKELLCTDCVQHYRSLRLTRNHTLEEIDGDHHIGNEKPTLINIETCRYHPFQQLQWFCRYHDDVICMECVETYHTSCSGHVTDLETAALGTLASSEFIHCRSEMENIMQHLSFITNNKEKIAIEFAYEIKDARERISNIRVSLNQYLDQIEATVLRDVDTIEKEVTEKLCIDNCDVKENREKAEYLHSKLVSATSDKDAFVLLKNYRSFKVKPEQVIRDMEYNMQSYYLNDTLLNPESIPEKINIDFGKIYLKSRPFGSYPSANAKISASCFQPGEAINHDKFVECSAITDEGNLLLAELNVVSSSRIYWFSAVGEELHHIKISGSPTDIAGIPGGNRVVVLVDENKLEFCSMKDFTVEANKIEMVSGCICVTASYNEIFVGYKKEIIVMDTNGQYIQTLKISNGSLQCIHAERNGDLYYSVSDTVYCRKGQGEEILLYNSKDLRGVTGIDLDIGGNVYISGKKSNNIHVLKQLSSTAEVVLKKEDGLEKPRKIFINKLTNTLYIQRFGTQRILVYHFM